MLSYSETNVFSEKEIDPDVDKKLVLHCRNRR